MDVKEALKRLRNDVGYSQTGMAQSAGMKPRTWSDWENEPPLALQWLVNLARKHNRSVDYILGLTNDPDPRKDKPFPDGGQELINYLSSMSDRGREQLLRIAKTLYEDDKEFREQEDWRRAIRSILGETTFTAIEAELPAMLTESVDTDTRVRRIRNTIRQNLGGDGSQ